MDPKDYLTLGVGSVALIVSVTSLILTFRQRAQENQRGVRKTLTETLGQLAEVGMSLAKLDAEHPEQTDQIVSLRRMHNSQRRYLANHAEYLVRQIPDLATDIDYNMLAQAFRSIGDYDKAQQYWELAVAKSESPVIRAMNLRGHGSFLFFQGNPQLGRKKYQESLEIPLPDTDNVRRDRADTYAMWARVELDFGYKGEALRLSEQAQQAADRIGHAGMRTSIQDYIRNLLAPLKEPKLPRPQDEA
jgi:tetratricopeptide (TPR) repeat protein